MAQVAARTTPVYLHRTLAHRALEIAAPLAVAFRVVVWMTSGIRPRQWVAVHRKHHAFSDVAGDLHSPVLLGYWTVQRKNVTLYRRAARDEVMVARYAKDVPHDALDRLLLDRGWLGLGLAAVARRVAASMVSKPATALLSTMPMR